MERVFFKEFQNYIQSEGEQILSKITAEDEKAMKSIFFIIQSKLYRLYSGKLLNSTSWSTKSEVKLMLQMQNYKKHRTQDSKVFVTSAIVCVHTSLTMLT